MRPDELPTELARGDRIHAPVLSDQEYHLLAAVVRTEVIRKWTRLLVRSPGSHRYDVLADISSAFV